MRPAPFLAAALALAAAPLARAILGVGDAAFVTVVADPAESANWAAQLERLSAQVAAANASVEALVAIRTFAGDPRAAASALPGLGAILAGNLALAGGPMTQSDLAAAWGALPEASRQAAASALGAPPSGGPAEAAFMALAEDLQATSALRGQVSSEQAQRRLLASELAAAWARLRAASTESEKQAALAEAAQLQAQDQVLASRRRAALDDLALSDRAARDASDAAARASDASLLSQSAALASASQARYQQAAAQRSAVLGRSPAPAAEADYAAVRLWTSADAGAPP